MNQDFENAPTIIIPSPEKQHPKSNRGSVVLAVVVSVAAGAALNELSRAEARANNAPLVEVPAPNGSAETAKQGDAAAAAATERSALRDSAATIGGASSKGRASIDAPASIKEAPSNAAPASVEDRAPLPKDILALANKGRFSEALTAIDHAGAPDDDRASWRDDLQKRWKKRLRSPSKDLERHLQELDRYLARWPQDREARALFEQGQQKHATAVGDLLRVLSIFGFNAELHGDRAKREYNLVASWRPSRDARLAMIADEKIGTLGTLAELLAKIGASANSTPVRLSQATIQIEETNLEVRFPIRCARDIANIRDPSGEKHLELMRCLKITRKQ